jgi:hypothetical protein
MTEHINPLFQFTKVKREKCKASILIEGLTGKGKSGLALVLGYALAKEDWSKVYDIDTENNSIKLFDGITSTSGGKFENFHDAAFTPDLGYKPSNYILFKESALSAGAEVVIFDSVSHAWMYEGGILDMINDLKKTSDRFTRDSYAAWGDPSIVAEKQKLFQLFRDTRCHIIATVRVKEKMEYETDDKGKAKVVSLGEQEIMQADVKYEPDLVLHMVKAGRVDNKKITYPIASVVKSRYAMLEEGAVYEFTPELCDQIREYLEEGTSPEELMEKQRKSLVTGVTVYLNEHKNAVPIWKVIKERHSLKDAKLDELSLEKLKEMFGELTLD